MKESNKSANQVPYGFVLICPFIVTFVGFVWEMLKTALSSGSITDLLSDMMNAMAKMVAHRALSNPKTFFLVLGIAVIFVFLIVGTNIHKLRKHQRQTQSLLDAREAQLKDSLKRLDEKVLENNALRKKAGMYMEQKVLQSDYSQLKAAYNNVNSKLVHLESNYRDTKTELAAYQIYAQHLEDTRDSLLAEKVTLIKNYNDLQNQLNNAKRGAQRGIDPYKNCHSVSQLTKRRKELLKIFHPDTTGGDTEITRYIMEQYDLLRARCR